MTFFACVALPVWHVLSDISCLCGLSLVTHIPAWLVHSDITALVASVEKIALNYVDTITQKVGQHETTSFGVKRLGL